jgi:hypothetical protein
VRQAIQAGLTKSKDSVILLSMEHDIVTICGSAELRKHLKAAALGGAELNQLCAALEKRDVEAGGQVFLIQRADGDGVDMQAATLKLADDHNGRAVAWTREAWNDAQLKLNGKVQ